MAFKFIPAHVKESKESVDNIGGILSMVLVGSLIMAINFAPVPGMGTLVLGLVAVVVVALVLFVIRQRRAKNPLYDLKVAARPTFWVAAVGGIIVFGSLMGAMFLGQQFMQNVLGYSTVAAGAAILPAAAFMILVAPRSAKLVQARGSRFTLMLSFAAVLIAFVLMLLLWKEGIPYWMVGIAYVFLGIGVGLGGTPSSNSLTASVPVTRVGMASGTADLQRDLGGALMQSIFGALLAAGLPRRWRRRLRHHRTPPQSPPAMSPHLRVPMLAPRRSRHSIRSMQRRSRPPRRSPSWRAMITPTSPASSQSCSVRRWSSSSIRRKRRSTSWRPSSTRRIWRRWRRRPKQGLHQRLSPQRSQLDESRGTRQTIGALS